MAKKLMKTLDCCGPISDPDWIYLPCVIQALLILCKYSKVQCPFLFCSDILLFDLIVIFLFVIFHGPLYEKVLVAS